MQVAKLLEAAKFHGIFFADVLGVYDIYKGNDAALIAGAQIPILDISLLISALAYNTKHISFGITASTTYENPYSLARKFSTLDEISNGRVGWNIVTSFLQSAADSFGLEQQIEHDERYRMADEFMEVVYKLLESSWEEDAVEANKETGVYSNPNKVHKINHDGFASQICRRRGGSKADIEQTVLQMRRPKSRLANRSAYSIPPASGCIER